MTTSPAGPRSEETGALSLAESRGDEYPGATDDHATLRAALSDGSLTMPDE